MEAMDYASSIRMLAVVLSDGACALLKASDGGLAPAEQLQFMHWVCRSNSGALAVRIGGRCSGITPYMQMAEEG